MTLEASALRDQAGFSVGVTPSTWLLLLSSLLALHGAKMEAQEAFTPPKAYTVERYEAGWNKNPFTLKTAPVSTEKALSMQDLAIGTFYGASDDPTIVVVNTKTHERLPLKQGATAPNGMMLKSISIKPSRKETVAVVTLGAETAVLHFDDSFIKQLSAPKAATEKTQKGGGGAAQQDRSTDTASAEQKSSGDTHGETSGGRTQEKAGVASKSAGGPATALADNIPTSSGRLKLLMPTAHSKTSSGQSH